MRKRLLILLAVLTTTAIASFAQTKTITGKVYGEESKPLAGVTIQLKGSKTISSTTNDEGNFSINVPVAEKTVLKLSYVNYVNQEVTVKGNNAGSVVLQSKQSSLDAVVVVGYGSSRRKDLTGAVEKLNIKDLSKAPVRSFEEALGGRAAGVQVVSSDGQPGSPVSIVIRGNNSITQENTPLYVIDGFPVEGANNNAINVSEIESIEVLKDASATAIYGARGANGVIIITTKKGKAGPTEISYNAYYASNSIIKKMDLLSPYEFVRYQFEYDSSNTKSTYLSNGRTFENYRNIKGVDWQDRVFRNSKMVNHEIAIRGGNGKNTFSISGSALNQEGIVKFSGYDRYQGRFRLDNAVSDKLKIGINVNYSALKAYGTIPSFTSSSSSTSNLMFSVWGYRPVSGDSTIDLSEGLDPAFELDLNDSRFNPLETVTYEVRNRFTNAITGNFNIDYQYSKNLTLKSTFGYRNDVDRNEEFNNTRTRGGSPYTSAGRVNGVNGSLIYNTKNSFVNENTVNFNKKINKKNTIDVLGGATVQYNSRSVYGMAATQLPNEQLGLSGLDEGVPTKVYSLNSPNTLVSFLARTNYNFDSKYLFTVSMRADGSSKFSDNNKWGYFPSGSFAWRLSKEKFMKKIDFIKDAKIRAGYGMTGNNRVDDFAFLPSLKTDLTLAYPFDNNPTNNTVVPASLGNADLKWETTAQTNLGMDLNLFDDRVNITADVYRKVTFDLLLNALLPPSSGFTSSYKNIGKVENKGLEFSFTTKNIEKDDFTWSTSFNIAFNRNKVLALNGGQESQLSLINWDNQWRGLPAYMAKVGQPLGLFYGLIWDGNYQYSDFDISGAGVYTLKPNVTSNTSVYSTRIQPGHIKYRDLNGDRVITDDDKTIIGDANPDFIGGFSNNLKYKNFDLNFFFQFSYGNDLLNANRLVFEGNSGRSLQNQFASVLDRWTPENQNNIMFVAKGDGDRQYSSRVIEDGSYLRLKTIQLGYEMPSALMKKAKIKSLRFYMSAQNLITWTKYTGVDPEVSVYNSALTPGFDYSVYPRAKTTTIGLNLNF